MKGKGKKGLEFKRFRVISWRVKPKSSTRHMLILAPVESQKDPACNLQA